MLSSMEQLMFLLLKDSDAAPNTETSVAPAEIWKTEFNKNRIVEMESTM